MKSVLMFRRYLNKNQRKETNKTEKKDIFIHIPYHSKRLHDYTGQTGLAIFDRAAVITTGSW